MGNWVKFVMSTIIRLIEDNLCMLNSFISIITSSLIAEENMLIIKTL